MPVIGLLREEVEPFYGQLKDMLRRSEVVAVGETGLEWATEDEIEKLKAQLAMAKETNIPVIRHTPIPRAPHKLNAIKKIF